VWGKIIGGMAGFAFGGPFGAIMGAAFGHAAEAGAQRLPFTPQFSFTTGFMPRPEAQAPQPEHIFALGVVILSAKLARVDGPVRRAEIDAFKAAFRIPPEAVRDIGLMFDEARDSQQDPIAFARVMGSTFADQPHRLEDVLNALFAIAAADGPINGLERTLLGHIATAFGVTRESWNRSVASTEDDPYNVLGLTRNATGEEIRAAWRRLVVENHPDSIASRGGAKSAVAQATEKVARINAAWDKIKRERKI
jgi:DnaJ like chaperone protein